MGRYQLIAIIIVLVGIIAFIICINFLPEEQRILVNYITIIGTITSVVGLILVYFQVRSLRDTTKETEKAVKESLKKTNQFISIADLSRAVRIVAEIQDSIRRRDYRLAQLRMRDLRDGLVQLENIVSAEFPQETRTYKIHLEEFNVDLTSLNAYFSEKDEINRAGFNNIINNLEKMSTLLNHYEGRLKFRNYGS